MALLKRTDLALTYLYTSQEMAQSRDVLKSKVRRCLLGQRAKKGIFITTSTFTDEARKYAASIDNKLVLIEGEELGRLMIDHNTVC